MSAQQPIILLVHNPTTEMWQAHACQENILMGTTTGTDAIKALHSVLDIFSKTRYQEAIPQLILEQIQSADENNNLGFMYPEGIFWKVLTLKNTGSKSPSQH